MWYLAPLMHMIDGALWDGNTGVKVPAHMWVARGRAHVVGARVGGRIWVVGAVWATGVGEQQDAWALEQGLGGEGGSKGG